MTREPGVAVARLRDTELRHVEATGRRPVERQGAEGDDARSRRSVLTDQVMDSQGRRGIAGSVQSLFELDVVDRHTEADPYDVRRLEEPAVARAETAQRVGRLFLQAATLELHDDLVATN